MEAKRPDPDELLDWAMAEEKRISQGKLKIFFGAAPGVGKTYAMLAAARKKREEGVDIVVGIAETHGRKETEVLLEGLENLPCRMHSYRGREIREFDLDAIVIDDTGMGGGVTDALDSSRYGVFPFNGAEASNNPGYLNRRAEGFFKLQEAFQKGWLKILPDTELQEQLLTIKYKYKTKDQKMIVSKDEMRREGLKSPDRADALMMAYFFADRSAEGNHYPDYCAPDEDLYRSVQDLPRWST